MDFIFEIKTTHLDDLDRDCVVPDPVGHVFRLNLGILGINRLRLESEAEAGNAHAAVVLELRRDFNLLLTTLLWGNVSINVLLTLLSDSVMAGVSAFLFSSVESLYLVRSCHKLILPVMLSDWELFCAAGADL